VSPWAHAQKQVKYALQSDSMQLSVLEQLLCWHWTQAVLPWVVWPLGHDGPLKVVPLPLLLLLHANAALTHSTAAQPVHRSFVIGSSPPFEIPQGIRRRGRLEPQ
jgi:hypothetical protein